MIVRLTKPLMEKKKKEHVVSDECFSYSKATGMAVLSAADVFKAAPKPGSPQRRRQPPGAHKAPCAEARLLGQVAGLQVCLSVCLSEGIFQADGNRVESGMLLKRPFF